MSEQSPYEKLGVSIEASFEEIQKARTHLLEQYSGDRQQAQMIEEAYDAVLMDRLRMRQEGKLNIPERIRYAEQMVQAPPSPPITILNQSPEWLKQLIDRPSWKDLLGSTGVFVVLMALSLAFPGSTSGVLEVTIALGIGFTLFCLNRKEHKFGRAFLLTIVGLITGLILGSLLVLAFKTPTRSPMPIPSSPVTALSATPEQRGVISTIRQPLPVQAPILTPKVPMTKLGISENQLITVTTLLVLWVVSSFLR
jgi:hypothetical protein